MYDNPSTRASLQPTYYQYYCRCSSRMHMASTSSYISYMQQYIPLVRTYTQAIDATSYQKCVLSHPFSTGEPGLFLSDWIMLLLTLKALRKKALQTNWRPANIAPFSGATSGSKVCTKFERAAPENPAKTRCSARRVLTSPVPRTNDSTHFNFLQQKKLALAMS